MDEAAYTVVKLSPLRKIIAARMEEAKRTIPHYRLTAEVEVDAMTALLRELRKLQPEAPISLNDLLIKACATALMDVPAVNIQWAEDAIHQFRSADIAIVTAVEGGLSTPVIRDADSKSLWDIAREVRALTARAAARTLKFEEISGGSFSISNLGMFGVDQFDAIISPPQCAILAIGAAKRRLVVDQEDTRIATVLKVTLSVDHRALDGVIAAGFLAALCRRIETPEHMNPAGER